jgi:hypothetical protein
MTTTDYDLSASGVLDLAFNEIEASGHPLRVRRHPPNLRLHRLVPSRSLGHHRRLVAAEAGSVADNLLFGVSRRGHRGSGSSFSLAGLSAVAPEGIPADHPLIQEDASRERVVVCTGRSAGKLPVAPLIPS